MLVLYITIGIAIYFGYTYIKSQYHYNVLRERVQWRIGKINKEIENDTSNFMAYCRRGTQYQIMQDFKKSNEDFLFALSIIEKECNSEQGKRDIGLIQQAIDFNNKPLPWSKGEAKNHDGSVIVYMLIDRFGNRRYLF